MGLFAQAAELQLRTREFETCHLCLELRQCLRQAEGLDRPECSENASPGVGGVSTALHTGSGMRLATQA